MKAEQKLVKGKVVHGRDILAQLPTGFGKTLTFQILPINYSMHLITDNGKCIPPVKGLQKDIPETIVTSQRLGTPIDEIEIPLTINNVTVFAAFPTRQTRGAA